MSKVESHDPLKPLWDDTGQDPQMDLLEWIKQRPRSEMQTGRRWALPVVVSVPKCRQKGTEEGLSTLSPRPEAHAEKHRAGNITSSRLSCRYSKILNGFLLHTSLFCGNT